MSTEQVIELLGKQLQAHKADSQRHAQELQHRAQQHEQQMQQRAQEHAQKLQQHEQQMQRWIAAVKGEDKVAVNIPKFIPFKSSQAVELAVEVEDAAKVAKETLSGVSTSLKVKKVAEKRRSVSNPQRACYRCGNSNHMANDCNRAQTACYRCGNSNHMANDCKFKDKT